MSRFTQRTVVAAGLAGALLAFAPARADTPRAPGLGCPGAAVDGPACRPARLAHRRARAFGRPTVAELGPGALDPAVYGGAGRYVSLLILGVGY